MCLPLQAQTHMREGAMFTHVEKWIKALNPDAVEIIGYLEEN